MYQTINFTVARGHQVASGMANDTRFKQGTIVLQRPFFYALGLDLSPFYSGTINARFDCKEVSLIRWDYQFQQVKWHKDIPAENFRFCRCQLKVQNQHFQALIYQPQAATKSAHFQPRNTIELLAPFISGLSYDSRLAIKVAEHTLEFIR